MLLAVSSESPVRIQDVDAGVGVGEGADSLTKPLSDIGELSRHRLSSLSVMINEMGGGGGVDWTVAADGSGASDLEDSSALCNS